MIKLFRRNLNHQKQPKGTYDKPKTMSRCIKPLNAFKLGCDCGTNQFILKGTGKKANKDRTLYFECVYCKQHFEMRID